MTQAFVEDNEKWQLFSRYDNNFAWNLEDTPSTDTPDVDTPIPEDETPQTGFWLGISSLGILVTLSLGGIYINNKMKKENKIIKL